MALGDYCFYANQSGVVKNSLAKVKGSICRNRNKKLNSNKSWFQSWFKWNPWLTTLLTSLAWPVVLLFFGLLIGPCVLNWLVNFMKNCIASVQLLYMHSHYNLIINQDVPSKVKL